MITYELIDIISITIQTFQCTFRFLTIIFSGFLYLKYRAIIVIIITRGIKSEGLKNVRINSINPNMSALRWIMIILIFSVFGISFQYIYLNPSEPIFPVNVVNSINEDMQYVFMKWK